MAKIKETMTKDGKEVDYNVLDEYVGKDAIGYRKLCEILDIKSTTGNAKVKQLTDIDRHYNTEKEGIKYKILSKRDETLPLPKDIRTSKYYNDLESIVLYLLQQEKDKRVTYWSTTRALMLTNMVNDKNYAVGRYNIEEASQVLEVDKGYMWDFYNSSQKKLKDIFTNTLSGMANRALIIHKECYILHRTEVEIVYNDAGLPMLDSKGNVETIRTKTYVEATIEEEKVILDITGKTLDSMGFTHIYQAITSNRREEYTKRLNEELYRRLGADYCYKAHRVVRNDERIARVVEEMENDIARMNINDLTVQCITNSKDKKLISNEEDKTLLIDYLIKSDDGSNNSATGRLEHMIKNFNKTQDEGELFEDNELFPF